MIKIFKKKRSLLPSLMVVAAILAGCTNNDYDFNEVDLTLGLGGDELYLPTSSTKEIALDDILKLNEGDCVMILDNGDYVFKQDGSDVAPAHPKIDKVTLTQGGLQTFNLNLDEVLRSAMGATSKTKTRAGVSAPVDLAGTVVSFVYDAYEPEILSLTSADIDIDMSLAVTFSPNLARCLDTIDELTITLPSYMVIEGEGGNVLRRSNVRTDQGLSVNVKVRRLDLANSPDFKINNGNIHLDGYVRLGVKTNAEITADKAQYLNDCYLSSSMSLGNITINGAKGKFDPKIDLNDLGDVEVTGTPDFLNDDDVVIDLSNPQILVEIESDMDVAANINATLTSIKDGATMKTIKINNIKIHPETTTKICVCRDAAKVDAAYAGYDKYEVADLSELIRTIPDRIKFAATTAVDNTNDASFQLGHEYTIKPSYTIVAPIAFGENANIVYTDQVDGMNDDIDGLELAQGAYVEVTASVENKLPVFLDTKVTPLSVDDRDISDLVQVTIENDIPAAADGDTAYGAVRAVAKGDIRQLDKLKFTIGGHASEGTESVTGVTLNKNKHSLKLDDIKVKLVGRVIYDAN